MTRRAGLALAAFALGAAPASARLVVVQTERGPAWTSVPEPAGPKLRGPTGRRLPYAQLVDECARRNGVDPRLVEAIIACESDFDPQAVSRAGAEGLMQLMPETARQYGVRDAFDAPTNVDAGTRHLRSLIDEFGGDWKLAVAAYNAGSTAVRRAGGIPPYPETVHYVRAVQHYLGFLGATFGSGGASGRPDGVSITGEAMRDPVLDWRPDPEPAPEPEPARRKGPPVVMTRDDRGRVVFTNTPASGRRRAR